jgi:hypothetical protein
MMQMIYNSPNYCVVEFKDYAENIPDHEGGFEIVDKASRREIFIQGALAQRFRNNVEELIASEPSLEEVDDFLSSFEGIMQQPVLLH